MLYIQYLVSKELCWNVENIPVCGVEMQRFHCLSWWNKDWQHWVTQTNGSHPECNLSRRTLGLLLISDARPAAWFFIRQHYLCPQGNETHAATSAEANPKSESWPLTTSAHKQMPTRAYTSTQKWRFQEMVVAIHFVRCHRTNFGSEPLLMSRSLMCKSSSPSAKLIRSPHNPAQVQPCSLLQYLSCVPNTVRPLTANKPVSKREKYAPTCNLAEQKKRKISKKSKLKDATGTGAESCAASLPSSYCTVHAIPVSIFTPLWKSDTDDKIFLRSKCKSLVHFISPLLLHRIIGLWLHCHVLSEMNAY